MKPSYKLIVAFVLVLMSIGGCGDDEDRFVSFKIGLHIKGNGQEVETADHYFQIEGGSADKSKAPIDSGLYAGDSSGTSQTIKTVTVDVDWNVVGKTYLTNPAIPGEPEFDEVPVFIIEALEVENGNQYTDDTSYSQQETTKIGFNTKNTANIDRATTASTWGLARDEYIVRFSDLSLLWDPDLEELWHTAGNRNNLVPGMEVLSKSRPSKGDFWVSPNGLTLYKVIGNENVSIGGKNVNTAKIEVRETSNADTPDILNRCIVELNDNDQAWTVAGPPPQGYDHDTTLPTVHLDPGCQGAFLHRKVGTEWWYNNVLVKEEATYYYVTVIDYGYEWYVSDGAGGRIRQTSPVKTAEAWTAGHKYVEFTFTEKKRTYQATLWEVIDDPWTD